MEEGEYAGDEVEEETEGLRDDGGMGEWENGRMGEWENGRLGMA